MAQTGTSNIRVLEPSVRHLLAKWAWWRRSGRLGAEVDWPKKTITGKFLDGMPGVNCPTCSGKGKVPSARLRIDRIMLVCPTCKGIGTIALDKRDPKKINPASVRSTRWSVQEDEVMLLLDRLVCSLRQNRKTEKHYFVLWSEYVSHKHETQEWKAAKLGISHGYFRKLLHELHTLIESGLRNSNIYLEAQKRLSGH